MLYLYNIEDEIRFHRYKFPYFQVCEAHQSYFIEVSERNMADITLYNDQPSAVTYVPNIFIDKYMVQANGDYVKIFLYLLRCINTPGGTSGHRCSISHMADYFDYTEKDITRALKYWEKMNLLRLEYDSRKNLAGICLLSTPGQSEPEAEKEVSAPLNRSDIQELIFVTEQYLGRTLKPTDLDIIFSWHDQMGLSAELIEFLVEKCVEKNHSSLYYMNKIAQEWSDLHITSVEEAKKTMDQNSSTYYAVLKAFGIRGRNLIPSELKYLKKWSQTQGFSDEMISLACGRTIQAIHEPRFEYADSILENWFKNGIHHTADVQKADLAYQERKRSNPSFAASVPKEKGRTAAPGSTRFSNFNQRDYDYQDLEQQLLTQSIQQS